MYINSRCGIIYRHTYIIRIYKYYLLKIYHILCLFTFFLKKWQMQFYKNRYSAKNLALLWKCYIKFEKKFEI